MLFKSLLIEFVLYQESLCSTFIIHVRIFSFHWFFFFIIIEICCSDLFSSNQANCYGFVMRMISLFVSCQNLGFSKLKFCSNCFFYVEKDVKQHGDQPSLTIAFFIIIVFIARCKFFFVIIYKTFSLRNIQLYSGCRFYIPQSYTTT